MDLAATIPDTPRARSRARPGAGPVRSRRPSSRGSSARRRSRPPRSRRARSPRTRPIATRRCR